LVGLAVPTDNGHQHAPLQVRRHVVRLNVGTLVLAALGAVLLAWRHPFVREWTSWQTVGAAIAIPACVLFVMARIELGGAFSVRAKATVLVTTGLYARIRNPIYVFGGLMSVGIFIFVHRPWWLLIWVVLIPVQWNRVRNEERVLEAKFGDVYRQYRRQTWF
jgi:protein-S-isoprenylcysteine O-methyltransferase Ste14